MCYLVVILIVVVQFFANKALAVIQYGLFAQTDKRIQYVTLVIEGIKTIKSYLWEPYFRNKVAHVRKIELNAFFRYALLGICFNSIYANAGFLLA